MYFIIINTYNICISLNNIVCILVYKKMQHIDYSNSLLNVRFSYYIQLPSLQGIIYTFQQKFKLHIIRLSLASGLDELYQTERE